MQDNILCEALVKKLLVFNLEIHICRTFPCIHMFTIDIQGAVRRLLRV